jgi:hypothetical protein
MEHGAVGAEACFSRLEFRVGGQGSLEAAVALEQAVHGDDTTLKTREIQGRTVIPPTSYRSTV